MTVSELIHKYLSCGEISTGEQEFLRINITRAELELLAAGPAGRGGVSRQLHKLSNILFAGKGTTASKKSAVLSPRTMFQTDKRFVRIQKKTPLSGGGVNGTGKKG